MSETTPALTPEEWAEAMQDWAQASQGSGPYGDFDEDAPLEGVSWATDLASRLVYQHSEERHALAALALHGEPFGFTWAMVDAIRDLLEEHRGDSYHPLPEPELALVEAAADRIASLLPPREKAE